MMKKVFVLGGNGFLGYYTVKELLTRGYEVTEMSLPLQTDEPLFADNVTSYTGNLFDYTDEQILDLLKGHYAFMYAAGADERTTPQAPAAKFFYEANVLPTQRLARLARQAGLKKFVLFNSYFSHFAEQWSDLQLNKQAYPRTRLIQEELAMLEGGNEMDVMSLRLPYIFGTMPGRTPLWKMFIDQVRGKEVVNAPTGGTVMVTVQQVAEAAVGAMEFGKHEGRYPIAAINMKFTEFYQHMVDVLGQQSTVVATPVEHIKPAMEQYDIATANAGLEHGIHLALSAEIQARDAFVDPELTAILQIKPDDVRAELIKTLKASV